MGSGSGGSLKIDLDLAHGASYAVDRVPIEVAAIDAVGWSSLGVEEGDAHVVQLGMSVALELDCLRGVESIKCVTAPRLRVGEAVGGLLDGGGQSIQLVMAETAHLPSPIRQEERNGSHQAPGEYQDPGAQAGRRYTHSMPHSTGMGRVRAFPGGAAHEDSYSGARWIIFQPRMLLWMQCFGFVSGWTKNPVRPCSSSSHSCLYRPSGGSQKNA